MHTMILDTANGIFKPFLNKGLAKPFFATNVGQSYTHIMTFANTPAVGDKIYIKNIPFADNLTGLKITTSTQVASVFSNGTSYTVPTADAYSGAVLVLKNHANIEITRIALGSVAALNELGKMQFITAEVSWKNSYVQFYDAGQGLDTSNAFLIQIYYTF